LSSVALEKFAKLMLAAMFSAADAIAVRVPLPGSHHIGRLAVIARSETTKQSKHTPLDCFAALAMTS
jgi:hypothetical protein